MLHAVTLSKKSDQTHEHLAGELSDNRTELQPEQSCKRLRCGEGAFFGDIVNVHRFGVQESHNRLFIRR